MRSVDPIDVLLFNETFRPCKRAMASNFHRGSCVHGCEPAVEAMLVSCVNMEIPDIPKGNPLAGKPFHMKRAKLIRQGMIHAGCNLPELHISLATPQPTARPSK